MPSVRLPRGLPLLRNRTVVAWGAGLQSPSRQQNALWGRLAARGLSSSLPYGLTDRVPAGRGQAVSRLVSVREGATLVSYLTCLVDISARAAQPPEYQRTATHS